MARRRMTAKQRRYFGGRRSARHSSAAGISPQKLAIAAGIYGLVRNKVSGVIAPLVAKLPLGQYSDEAILGIAGWFAAKKGRGLVKQGGMAILTIEAYRAGELASQQILPTSSNSGGMIAWQ